MTDSQPDHIPVAAPDNANSPEALPVSVGTMLREARIRLGLSVGDVSSRIKFAPRQIEALEADDFARLPEVAFVRGFLRSYARLLQLDPAPLLAALPQTPDQPAPLATNTMAEVPFPNIYSERKLNVVWLAAALAVAIVLALFTWLYGKGSSAPKETHVETLALPAASPVSPAPVPEPVIPETPAKAPPPKVVAPAVKQAVAPPAKPVAATGLSTQAAAIRLTFDEESWVEVTDREGKIISSQINLKGSEQNLNGKPPFSVVIGRASGVHLYYKGKAVDIAPHTRADVAHLTLE